jgi:hypothetical protein
LGGLSFCLQLILNYGTVRSLFFPAFRSETGSGRLVILVRMVILLLLTESADGGELNATKAPGHEVRLRRIHIERRVFVSWRLNAQPITKRN